MDTIAVSTLASGLAFGESPRWHDGRLWFSNWVAPRLITGQPLLPDIEEPEPPA